MLRVKINLTVKEDPTNKVLILTNLNHIQQTKKKLYKYPQFVHIHEHNFAF